MATTYDLNEIFDALAGIWNGLETGEDFDGVAQTLSAESEVQGDIQTPAIVLELDDLTWDENMGDGSDAVQVAATLLIQNADARGAQRALRAFLSRKPTAGIARVKKALEEDQTLGGLVSYAHMVTARRIGGLTYDGIDYLGAELIIEVVTLPS